MKNEIAVQFRRRVACRVRHLCPRDRTRPNSARPTVINEFVNNHTGTDTNEYIEIFQDSRSNLSEFWLVDIEGDSTSAGLIDDGTSCVSFPLWFATTSLMSGWLFSANWRSVAVANRINTNGRPAPVGGRPKHSGG